MAIKQLAKKKDGLGLWSLTGLVVGSMIGAGIFNLVQGTAEAAGPLATIIAWLITGVGMIFLILSFRNLNIKKPKLNAGVYTGYQPGLAISLTRWQFSRRSDISFQMYSVKGKIGHQSSVCRSCCGASTC